MGGADAIDHDVEHRISRTVDAVTGTVGGTNAACNAGREKEQRKDVSRIEGELGDALVVDDFSEDGIDGFEEGGGEGERTSWEEGG